MAVARQHTRPYDARIRSSGGRHESSSPDYHESRLSKAPTAMPANCMLLLAAGFSKNWNGLLAREVTNSLMSRLQSNARLLAMLNKLNFEDVLSQVQGEYLQTRSAESETQLGTLQEAVAAIFDRMNKHFEERPFEFSNDVAQMFKKFLVRFDAIFTLNQDLLLEIHYKNEDAALWYDLGLCQARHTLACPAISVDNRGGLLE